MVYIKKLLVITIGESPRDDITPTLEKYLTNVDIFQIGLLDNLHEKEMKIITNITEKEKTLVSKKRNGKSILLNGDVVEDRLEKIISKADEDNYENILLLCTGEFDNIITKNTNVFIPDKIISPLIANIFPEKKMGLLIPDKNQISMMNSKWGRQGIIPFTKSASPYSDITEIINACEKLEKNGADFILMDCMGYTEKMKERVIEKVNIPVILSNSLLVKLLSEVL